MFLGLTLTERAIAMKEKRISAAQARELIARDNTIILLDVRTPEEYAKGHIPGARLLPLDEIAEKAKTVLPDTSAPVLVYCHSGRRSALAARTLTILGYTDIYDMGGLIDWEYGIVTD